MTLPIHSMISSGSSVTCAVLLFFVAGSEWDSADHSKPYAVENASGVLSSVSKTIAAPDPEVATTLLVSRVRERYPHDEPVRLWRREALAYSEQSHREPPYREPVREQVPYNAGIRQWVRSEQADPDILGRVNSILETAQLNLRAYQQQSERQRIGQATQATDPWQSQQPTQTLDGIFQQMQRQQDEQLHERMLQQHKTWINGSGGSNP